MDVARIRAAVNARIDELGRIYGAELAHEELRRRMAEVRGSTSGKVIDLLVNDRPKSYFQIDILRAASAALEWHPTALEEIEAGIADPGELERVPWSGRASRTRDLEHEVETMRTELDQLRGEVRDLGGMLTEWRRRLEDDPARPGAD